MRSSQSPSTYSIYRNALPYYIDRADLCHVTDEEEHFASQWINSLFSRHASSQMTASNLAVDKLRHLYFESKNLERTSGAKTFGLGYPFLIDSFEKDLVVAPLFIWPLSIEPAQTKVDAWVIKFEDGHQVKPNYRLLRHLKEKYDLNWEEKVKGLIQNGQFNQKGFFAFCDELAERLQFENIRPEGKVHSCPGIDEIGALSENGAVHWSSIIGLFPPQFSRPISGVAKPEDVLSPCSTPVPEGHCIFTYLSDDPYQASALETVFRNKVSIHENDVAHPKNLAVVNLLINALSNGQKCLVVSERAPALKTTQNLLSKTGLNQLHFLLDDAQNDKLQMLELLRVAAEGATRSIAHNTEDFLFKKNKYSREKQKLDAAFEAVRAKVFGEYDWTETVGLFLASNRVEGRELLASQLNNQEFVFTVHEYEDIKQGILGSYPVFKKIKTLAHPLSNLHDEIFKRSGPEEGLDFVGQQLKSFSAKAAQLQHRYITKVDTYAARLKEHYENHYEYLAGLSKGLKEKLLGYGDRFGDDFRHAGTGSLKIPSLFSSKKKQILKAQEDVAKAYRSLEKAYSERQYFDFHFAPSKEGMNIPKNTSNLDAFSKSLEQWHARIETIVQEEIMRLNGKTAHPDLDYKEQITDLEYSLDVLLEELNENKLYQKGFENKTLTLPQRQKYLESIIEQLETTQLNLRDFPLFFQWQSQWLNLNPLSQKVIRALVKVKPTDWMAAFESWFFNNLLLKAQTTALPTDGSLIDNQAESWHSLKPLIINQILHHWQNIQLAELKSLKRKNKEAYRLIFEKSKNNKAKQMALGDILENSFEAVTAILPVLFVTPHVAQNVLPRIENFYDLLIFVEANQFSVESASAIASMGKRIVLSGSNDSFEEETSLLQYAFENGAPSVSFSNTIGPDKTNDLTEKSSNPTLGNLGEILSENVEGRFHDFEGTNDVEAQHIIRLLNQVKQTPQRVYPSVGIITLTVEQRDLVSNYLLRLKQQNSFGSEKIQQLERNGLGVFHINELIGQQFDILILSCTFGLVNLKGMMTKKIVFLNTPEGVARIRSLVNHRGQRIIIVHSLPLEQIDRFIAKRADKGSWLLANYIRLAEGIKNGNKELVKRSMEGLGMEPVAKPTKSIFAQEIGNALLPYIEEKRLSKNLIHEGIPISLSIKPIHRNEPPIVINPDGFFSEASFTNSNWENSQRGNLVKNGFIYLPVWSINWLKNPAHEARLLASKIIKQDSAYKQTTRENVEDEPERTGKAIK